MLTQRLLVFGGVLVVGTVGCAGRYRLADNRPPVSPAPADVQAEIRDARYFLPIPERDAGPETGMFTVR